MSLLAGWDLLRHGGLLLDAQRLSVLAEYAPDPSSRWLEGELRRRVGKLMDVDGAEAAEFVQFVLTEACGFRPDTGAWQRGSSVSSDWGYPAITGETIKPRQLWRGSTGGVLPVFIDREKRIGIGRGRKLVSQVVQWLRQAGQPLGMVTNGWQWRLVFAGLDFDAWCEWDVDLWLEEGGLSAQVAALRTLLQPALWKAIDKDTPAPLAQAVLDSRKGQSELSRILGERVREAVEILVQGHGDALQQQASDCNPAEIYRAAVRIVMRLVVILFAESRELLPRDNAVYHGAYGINGLLEQLERQSARAGARLAHTHSAWPRMLALFHLVQHGAHHPDLLVPAYGGELFAAGDPDAADSLSRALAVFERACFATETLSDREVHRILERLTRTRVKIRQGRSTAWTPAPVDFSDFSSEYIGILYEGLLDFELRTAPESDPVIFLAVGNQPALPLSRLEAMEDRQLKELLEKMKDTSSSDEEETAEDAAELEEDGAGEVLGEAEAEDEDEAPEDETPEEGDTDIRHTTRGRAENWARRAVEIGKLVKRPAGSMSPERRLRYEESIARKARQLVSRVVLPGEWYLVRWGGTRKGSGTFYTRPGLAVPTVHRTLRPLAYETPLSENGQPDPMAVPSHWKPRRPEEILALKVLDPGCGSGSFPVAALRFLTDALYASLHHHQRIREDGERSVIALLAGESAIEDEERLHEELLPCRPDDPQFEPRLKAILRRHVVERCIYGTDLDPLAVELCRLALWVETLDRNLPFSFLDHKIKCGNALVGAWFDQFRHYPVMAWKNREGGDKGHSNGAHFEKEGRGKAIKAFVKDVLTPDLQGFLQGRDLFRARDLREEASSAHDEALGVLAELHDMPVQDTAERARLYRERLLGSAAYQSLKRAMDVWCACWFWPSDELDSAPLPSTLHQPSNETRQVGERLTIEKRFFHWELEFPDVFRESDSGFDAVIGNPPWDTLQPNSKEYFSNIDPLYRAYGKQEALQHQSDYFADKRTEESWLDYCASFANESNWMKFAANPWGDPESPDKATDRFAIARGKSGVLLHERWRSARLGMTGYADPEHPYRYRGEGKAYTYKLFLERGHALLKKHGRLGFIVPSGLYSDHGTGQLRELFLDKCRWEWLFGFENRDKVFDIDSRFKFNPVIIQKGGRTEAIHTAFMRRNLEDWAHAERFVTDYSRERVAQFSPRSKAILEIQSARDLEILEKIYANSVLLGDDGPDGWGITYRQGDFNMTSDSKLFPPRPKWEEQGYRPDEYSRWVKGNWRPIEELWAELGVDPGKPVPVEIELEDWLFETSVSPEEREARKQFVHGHLLKPGDVQRTEWRVRCAQPPYDSLPIARADIPEGIILSRDADAWIREGQIEDLALPLYEGRMIGQFDFSQKEWLSGKGRSAIWREVPWELKHVGSQYLIREETFKDESIARYVRDCAGRFGKAASEAQEYELRNNPDSFLAWWLDRRARMGFIDVTSATNERTTFAALVGDLPCGNSVPILESEGAALTLSCLMNSFTYDMIARYRCSGLHLNWFVVAESPLPPVTETRSAALKNLGLRTNLPTVRLADFWLNPSVDQTRSWRSLWAITRHERTRLQIAIETWAAVKFGLGWADINHILNSVALPSSEVVAAGQNNPKGFWRVDRQLPPCQRKTTLSLIAFRQIQLQLSADTHPENIDDLLASTHLRDGWPLPEKVRLSDYGLGQPPESNSIEPLALKFGPRFLDWQLSQSEAESWLECRLHARNQLGAKGFERQMGGIDDENELNAGDPAEIAEPKAKYSKNTQGNLF